VTVPLPEPSTDRVMLYVRFAAGVLGDSTAVSADDAPIRCSPRSVIAAVGGIQITLERQTLCRIRIDQVRGEGAAVGLGARTLVVSWKGAE